MPRVKQSNPKRVPRKETSTDAELSAVTPAVEGASDPVSEFAVGVDGTSQKPAKVGPKKARVVKPKPCVRCEERRARERQYAKSSRLRLRLAASAPPTTPADGFAAPAGGEAASAASAEGAGSASAPAASQA
jgi:hypothetical protein